MADSIWHKILQEDGGILPLEEKAFVPSSAVRVLSGDIHEGILEVGILRSRLEAVGFRILDERPDLPGWYTCELPNGWTVDRTENNGPSWAEKVTYYDASGAHKLAIISMKDNSTQCNMVCLNL